MNGVRVDDIVDNDDVDDSYHDYSFNCPVGKEVSLTMRKLKNGKAAGSDGIIPEMLNMQVMAWLTFVKYFNVLFDDNTTIV